MKDIKGELLFGNVAVQLGFTTGERVRQAIQHQEELVKLGVRKPMGEILLDQGILSPDQVRAVVQYQDFRRERASDKKLGKVAVLNGFVSERDIQEALAHQKQYFRKNQTTLPLGEILVDKGFVTSQQLKALVRLQNRLTRARAAEGETIVGIRECTGCFEHVPMGSPKCPHCGNMFEKLHIKSKCKACGHHQGEAGEYCAKCGANLVTGQMPNPGRTRACKKCGKYSAVYQQTCLHCGYFFDGTMIQHRKKTAEKRRQMAAQAWRWIVLIGFLGGVALAVMNIKTIGKWLRSAAEGEHVVEAKEAVEDYVTALKFRDQKQFPDYEAVFQKMFQKPSADFAISGYDLDRIKADDKEATAYVVFKIGKLDQKTTGMEDLIAALENLQGIEKRSVTLYLKKVDGKWKVSE